ncbi:MFS transporter [Desmospora profundinema]|uniref:MFS family permease n=1 Tax=Desmospora profundinema TaxID=1571184 RepID=A0ABU1IJ04_9BACL|nr:MFS transporter [Desmospora profundinema]MDR6224750.1 MFS family permease [Desmospora profundinema]
MLISHRFRGLWRNTDFLKLWVGETISLFGSSITSVALPLAAVINLQATPAQMGFLNAAFFSPYLLISLFAGVWIDRARRLPIMIGANIGRAILLGLIPFGFYIGFLEMNFLYVIAFLVGVLTVLFEIAYQSYLPSLVKRTELVEGNSKLQASASIAQVSGPSLGGILVSLFTAPVVILTHALSCLISAYSLSLIRKPESKLEYQGEYKSVFREIKSGLHFLFTNSYLRAIAAQAATYNFFYQVVWTVIFIYMARELHFGPSSVGFVVTFLSVGALLGSLMARYFEKRFAMGPTIIASMFIGCGAYSLIPIAGGSSYMALLILVLSFFLIGFGVVISNIHVISLRQSITPHHLLGRMNASYRFVITGTTPIGALIGGTLGSLIGLHMTLIIGAVGTLSSLLWVLLSPIKSLYEIHDPAVQKSSSSSG